jgi:thiamine monophosphate synthase
VSDELPAALAGRVLDAAQEAFTQGLQVVALVSAIIAAAAAVGVAVFLREVKAASPEPADARADPVAESR